MAIDLIAPPAGAVFQVDAYDVEGQHNAFRPTGTEVAYCVDQVAPSTPLVTFANYLRPSMKNGAGENSMAFDGVANLLSIPSSASRLAFVASTGVFDLFLAFRGRFWGDRYVIGSYGGANANEKMFFVRVNDNGSLTIVIGNGAGQLVVTDGAMETRVPNFTPTVLMIRGDGSNLKVSQNLFDFESTAFTGAFSSGNLVNDAVIGAFGLNQNTSLHAHFQGDLFFASMYSSNLSTSQLITMRSALRSRAGADA